MSQLPDLDHLSHAEKDALIRALWAQVQSLTTRVADLEARLAEPSKTPDNSSLPPSKGQRPNQPEKAKRVGPRQGSLGREGVGRPLACTVDETVTAKVARCAYSQGTSTHRHHTTRPSMVYPLHPGPERSGRVPVSLRASYPMKSDWSVLYQVFDGFINIPAEK